MNAAPSSVPPPFTLGRVPFRARFADSDWYIWCGSMARGDDGRCHLFYSRWPRRLGHSAWVTHSEIARAVADDPLGPYVHEAVVLPARGACFWDGLCTHNPTVARFDDRYYLYYMGNTGDGRAVPDGLNWTHRNHQRIGVAVADRPEGPWTRFDCPIIAPTPGFHDALCCANPTVTERVGGGDGYLMIYKAVADRKPLPFGGPVVHVAATAPTPTGPWVKHGEPVFTVPDSDTLFPAEDPFIWQDGARYHAIVKDMGGFFTGAGKSLARFVSADGLHWHLADTPLVATTGIVWEDGRRQKLHSLERPQVWRDEEGIPRVLFCAADEDEGRGWSFNLGVPLVECGPMSASDAHHCEK